MKFLISLSTSLLLVSIVGCAFSKDDTSPALKQQLQQDAQVNDTFGPIIGTYEGTVNFGSGTPQEVRLITKIVRESNGADSNGAPLFKSVAKGIYKRMNPLGFDQTLLAAYDPRGGTLGLTKVGADSNSNSGKGSSATNSGNNSGDVVTSSHDDVTYIEATINGQRITGIVNTVSGATGQLDMSMTTHQTGVGTPENENYLVIKSEISKIVGSYKGTIPDRTAQGGIQKILINLGMTDDGYNIFLPGKYFREDVPEGNIDLALVATYKINVTPRQISFSGQGKGTYTLLISGPITQNPQTKLFQIDATVLTEGALIGHTILVQQPAVKSNPPTAPSRAH